MANNGNSSNMVITIVDNSDVHEVVRGKAIPVKSSNNKKKANSEISAAEQATKILRDNYGDKK